MGGQHTDGTVMVGQYTQTRQRELRVKIVKSGHSMHYKRRVLPWIGDNTEQNLRKEIENLKELEKENIVRRKKEIVKVRKVGMHR